MNFRSRAMAPMGVIVATTALLTAGISACSSTSSGGSSTPLTMWARAETGNFLTPLVKSYNSSHSRKIDLTLVPDAQVTQKYSTASASDSGPDIAVIEIGRLPQFLSSGWLQDITTDVNGLSYKSTLSSPHMAQGTYQGKNYALPLSADVSVLYWNKNLFRAAGLNPDLGPTTWDSIRADAQAITKTGKGNSGYFFSGGCGGCMAFTMLGYTWAQGGEVMTGESTKSPKAEFAGNTALGSTLQFYRDIVNDGSTSQEAKTENGANQFGPFFSGKVGMFVNGTYPYGELKASHPNIDFGIGPIPNKDGSKNASFAGGDDIAITKKVDHATGVSVLKWFTDQGQTELAKSGVLPIRSDIATKTYEPLDPRNQVFVEALHNGHIPKSPRVNAIFFDNASPFAGLVQAGVFGSGSIDAALKDAQTAADKITG